MKDLYLMERFWSLPDKTGRMRPSNYLTRKFLRMAQSQTFVGLAAMYLLKAWCGGGGGGVGVRRENTRLDNVKELLGISLS